MKSPLYIAVDLGAGSGRVFLIGFDPDDLQIEEIRRFHYPPREAEGLLRWDLRDIFDNVIAGLREAGERASELGRSIESVGVDSWAVDYGWLNADGELVSDPVCYRDPRTLRVMGEVFDIVPRSEIFERTGIQFLNFNTLFQLYAERANIDAALRMLLLPDLINFLLTGKAAAEYTNATTTQMVNAATGDWDRDLLDRLQIPAEILSEIVPAGTAIGKLSAEISATTGLTDLRVIAPATHDTASAVAAAPLPDGWAYISSGTWSLIGIELSDPLINTAAASQNFTNEGGVDGSVRFLKNVMGLWIFESCRREWQSMGDVSYEAILSEIDSIKDLQAFIFPDDERFLSPASMLAAIKQQLDETGQRVADTPAAISKMIFDSLAFRYASVLRTIEDLTEKTLAGVQILGGGGRNPYLNQMTANACGLRTRAGLAEATVVGNAIVQAISAGRFGSLADGRAYVSKNFEFEEFDPQQSVMIDDARSRYASIEAKFVR